MQQKNIVITGAKNNNLKNVSLTIPRNKLIVFTGVSGSGKSTLAFDTIYAEGQRRYIESLSSYARQFLGQAEKPNVESIEGLSPAISIDQKTTSHNPRSTVGTITEIYDYLRLLYARIGIAHCPICGREIVQQTIDQVVDSILSSYNGLKVQILAPIAKAEKGTHKKALEKLEASGYIRVRVDGTMFELGDNISLEKTKKHDIEVVVDRLVAKEEQKGRLSESLEVAFKLGNGISVVNVDGIGDVLFSQNYACPEHGINLEGLEPRMFSFNSPYGACSHCMGLGSLEVVDPELIVPNKALSLSCNAIKASGWYCSSGSFAEMFFEGIARHYGFTLDTPFCDIPKDGVHALLYGTDEKLEYFRKVGKINVPFTAKFEGVINNLERRFRETASEAMKEELKKYMCEVTCPECNGKRLKPEVLAVTVGGKNIHEFCSMPIDKELNFIKTLHLNLKEQKIANDIFKEIKGRLEFLNKVGLSYLALARSATTISGGESQRLRLATQIGAGLMGVLYILDEPSIGLHQRDNDRLIATLKNLRDIGNTVIVVEHDEDIMYATDYIVDIGPGAGVHGGKIVSEGSIETIKNNSESLTGLYLSGKKQIAVPKTRRAGNGKFLEIKGAAENNLKNIDVRFPLGKLIVVTGVSGSGKSTLINQILYRALSKGNTVSGKHKKIIGQENIARLINIDQSPIGRTPRSNPATYTSVFSDIRELFASLPESKARGYSAGRFSFNVAGGRCEACAGDGMLRIEMHFLPDVFMPCEVCGGSRYNRETLNVRYKNKNIADVLDMTIEEAVIFFDNIPKIKRKLKSLYEIGLGYIKLGQSSTTLSGGEAQRVKLGAQLSKQSPGSNLYLLDEPTTGLHFADVDKLILVLHKLVDAGSTVITVEHNLDVIKNADYIIDLGPEGGDFGGEIVCEGTPEEVAKNSKSYTGYYLSKKL